jgi:Protein of unknown function (DUF3455)
MTVSWRRIWPILFGAGLMAAQIAPPEVPDNLKPPSTEAVLLEAHGTGKQIYACQAIAGSSGKFDWVVEKPQADLLDSQGQIIGRHYEGPTWESTDGSKVTGQLLQRAKAPRAGAVQWLLLKAKSTQGAGIFGRVTYIQRVATVGGAAPAGGCDQSHTRAEVAIEYQAEYYFYGPRK